MSKKTVLIVDDEEAIRDVLEKINNYFGYEVILAVNGEDGWQKWQDMKPDLTITDVYMPKMNGIQLLRNIRKANHKANVILITGFPHYRQLVDDSNSKPTDFMEKPFDIQQIAVKIKNLLGEATEAV